MVVIMSSRIYKVCQKQKYYRFELHILQQQLINFIIGLYNNYTLLEQNKSLLS